MADKTLFNYFTDITVVFGAVSGSYTPVIDLGVKRMFRAFMLYSSFDQPVSLKFSNDGAAGEWDDWSSSVSYAPGAVVKASTGDAYQSLQNANIGNDPISSPSWWKAFSVELTIPAAPNGWRQIHDNFRHNSVIQLKHGGTPPTAGYIKIVSWRAE